MQYAGTGRRRRRRRDDAERDRAALAATDARALRGDDGRGAAQEGTHARGGGAEIAARRSRRGVVARLAAQDARRWTVPPGR